ncbi:hypothetical protein [Kribbella sp. VKM Ac-2568]|uniref:hypothetical protein n=1 Tax=Kribbella sp. VKM Ac-2568 TaxID=2512219 RepID=UPI00104ABC05|nr:hypothetical protein [Kribbella sp. VKM Ac-2568]TCM34418.1 putative amidohydrolase [Kribbella sp. VKM Ac-2568]
MRRSGESSLLHVDFSDPADVFVQIYDHIPEKIFRSDAIAGWFRDPLFWKVADAVTEECLQHGTLDPERISELVARGEEYALAVLTGIDDALTFAAPWSTSIEQYALVDILGRYLESGQFNLETEGGLLPRRSYPGRPLSGKEKHHYFRVVRVSPRVWGESYLNLVWNSDIDPWVAPNDQIFVAFVPTLASYDDLEIDLFEDGQGKMRYRLGPRPTVLERLPAILEAAERSGAHLAILPEGCLSDEIFAAWRELLARSRPGRHSQLMWLLLGTGPVGRPGNRAVLVDRMGRELLRQDKLSDFTLTGWQLDRWDIPHPGVEVSAGTLVLEDIPRDIVFHTSDGFLGRVGVLVCESLSRWPDGRSDEIVGPGASHIFAPVFSKPIRRQGWEDIASTQLANLIGSWVMVSNSLVTTPEPGGDEDDAGFSGLVSGPWSEPRERYDVAQMFAASSDHLSAAEVMDRNIPGGYEPRLHPFVRSALMSQNWFPELDR